MRVGTDTITIRVSADDTGGALLAAEVRMPAGGGPPALHRHAAPEVYRVDAGELAIYRRGRRRRRSSVARPAPATSSRSPAAAPTRSATSRRRRARPTSSSRPATEMERFVHAAAALDDPPSPARVVAVAQRHGVTFAGPVPAPATRP